MLRPTTLAELHAYAKKLRKQERRMTKYDALDKASKAAGFKNYTEALSVLGRTLE